MTTWAASQPTSAAIPEATRGTAELSPEKSGLSTPVHPERPQSPSQQVTRHYAVHVEADDLAATGRRLRIVVAKPGLDGHDRGAKVVARALRDAGMEVIYTGLHQTPEQIVATALAEDADAIGLSVLSGAHLTLFARVLDLLRVQDAADIVVFGGGIIPEADRTPLKEIGVAQVFTPGATMADIVSWVRGHVGADRH